MTKITLMIVNLVFTMPAMYFSSVMTFVALNAHHSEVPRPPTRIAKFLQLECRFTESFTVWRDIKGIRDK